METFIIQGEILAAFRDGDRNFVVVKDQNGILVILPVADAATVKT